MSSSHGEPLVLALSGELDVGTVLIVVRAVAAALAARPAPQVIVLDLADLRFLGAAGVRVLCAAADHAAAESTTLRVVTGGNSEVERALRLSGMDRVLDVYPDRVAAVRAGDRHDFLRLATRMWES
ncbi:STAS domain-containing protein [Amycolatopsis sp. NPDC051128]|uniref:STAS domain-containing protein n=1 Tax=Amycolatopsis sp. NPDC051128 TaxID=3155412 RepID=UPI003448F1A8